MKYFDFTKSSLIIKFDPQKLTELKNIKSVLKEAFFRFRLDLYVLTKAESLWTCFHLNSRIYRKTWYIIFFILYYIVIRCLFPELSSLSYAYAVLTWSSYLRVKRTNAITLATRHANHAERHDHNHITQGDTHAIGTIWNTCSKAIKQAIFYRATSGCSNHHR